VGAFEVELGVVVVDDADAEDPVPEVLPVEAPPLVPDGFALDVLEEPVLALEVLA
jgi:hypothetical protein